MEKEKENEKRMARMVGLCRDGNDDQDENNFKQHQLPVFVEDMRTMIVEFMDPCEASSILSSSSTASTTIHPTLKQFRDKVSSMKPEELRSAVTIGRHQFNNVLSQLVPCVGCRRSVEKLYGDLSSMKHPAIYPLTINRHQVLTVHDKDLSDVQALYDLLIKNGQNMRLAVESLTKYRKNNKRCSLHSLEIHMCRGLKTSWEELWEVMSEDCRDECCVVESDSLLDMLETYLEKHRFCTECRAKVMKAFHLLISDGDKTQEKGFNPLIYQGLRYCPTEQHLHLKPSVQYLDALVDRAEPELMGGRERHAKTLDVAQGEVLTCLGLYMYDRLHRLVMALKTLQTTFQLLSWTGVIALNTHFQETLERKHGLSDSLERLCAELQGSAASPSSQKHQSLGKGANGPNNGHIGGANGNGKRGKKKPAKSASSSSVSVSKSSVLTKVLMSNEDECPNCVRRSSISGSDSPICGRQHGTGSPSPVTRSSSLGQRSYSLPRGSSISVSSGSSPPSASSDLLIANGGGIIDEIVDQQHEDNEHHDSFIDCTISKHQDDGRLSTGAADDDECSSGKSCCHDGGYCSQELSPGGGSPSGACRLTNKPPHGAPLHTHAECRCVQRHPNGVHNEDDCCDEEEEEDNDEKSTRHHHLDLFAGHSGFCSCSLLDMLEEEGKEENGTTNEDSMISPEDVKWFRENQTLVSDKRRALRERLVRQFRDMQERMQARNPAQS